jgi:hypothetical protein
VATVGSMNRPQRRVAPSGGADGFLFGLRDAIVAVGSCAIAMAAVLGLASVVSSDLVGGGAGPALARLFAAALAITGGFAILLGGLISPEPVSVTVTALPLAAGAACGFLEGALFIAMAPPWLLTLMPLAAAGTVAGVQWHRRARMHGRDERRRR